MAKRKEKTFVERWQVDIIESERGWGQRVDERKVFKTRKLADRFAEKYNESNNEPTTPDWYMFAACPKKIMVENVE